MSQILINLAGSSGGVITAVNGGNNITVNTVGTVATVNVSGTTNHAVQVGNSLGALTSLGIGTTGQLLTSNGAGVDPSFQTISLRTVFPWNIVTVNTNMSVNNGYITNSVGTLTVTLPAVAVVGDIVRVTGISTGQWLIAQNAGQAIFFGNNASTTVGVTGSIGSTNTRDAIEIVCVVTNTSWNILSQQGNLSFN